MIARLPVRLRLAAACALPVLLLSGLAGAVVPGARPLDHFASKYFKAKPEGRTALEAEWRGRTVTFSGEIIIGGMFSQSTREHIVAVAPDGANYVVMMKGREGEWQGAALKDAVAGRRATVTGRLDSVEGQKYWVWVEASEVRIIGQGSDDITFLGGYFRDLEQGRRVKRGYEASILAIFNGQATEKVAGFLGQVAVRDFPFERLDVPRIKETAIGILGRMGEVAVPTLRKVAGAYSRRTGLNNRRVFGYSVVCLGDAGDRRAWEYAETLDKKSGVELACYFMLFERSRDLLPEKKWTAVLKLADQVLRMNDDSTTKRHAQEAIDAYTSETWGKSPRHGAAPIKR
jgi:hypothetical protein